MTHHKSLTDKILKLPFRPESMLSASARFQNSIGYATTENCQQHVFDFKSGLRVVSYNIRGDLNIDEIMKSLKPEQEFPLLRLTASTDGQYVDAVKYPKFENMEMLSVEVACTFFDLTGMLMPLRSIRLDHCIISYYCPYCVGNNLSKESRKIKLSCQVCKPIIDLPE